MADDDTDPNPLPLEAARYLTTPPERPRGLQQDRPPLPTFRVLESGETIRLSRRPPQAVAGGIVPMQAEFPRSSPDPLTAIMADMSAKKEEYIRAWIAETGLHPSECELIVTIDPGPGLSTVYKMSVRRRR